MKHLVGKEVTKEVGFMGDKVTIRKLSAGKIMEVQKETQKAKNADPLDLVRIVISAGVLGGEELSKEDYLAFPLDELNDLVTHVLEYSGLGGAEAEGN